MIHRKRQQEVVRREDHHCRKSAERVMTGVQSLEPEVLELSPVSIRFRYCSRRVVGQREKLRYCEALGMSEGCDYGGRSVEATRIGERSCSRNFGQLSESSGPQFASSDAFGGWIGLRYDH